MIEKKDEHSESMGEFFARVIENNRKIRNEMGIEDPFEKIEMVDIEELRKKYGKWNKEKIPTQLCTHAGITETLSD